MEEKRSLPSCHLSVMGCRDARDLFLNDFVYRRPTTAQRNVCHNSSQTNCSHSIDQCSDPTFFFEKRNVPIKVN